MRYISLLVLALSLLINSAYAQSSLVARRNDNAATVLAPTNLQLSALAVDSSGRLFIGGSQVEDTVAGSGWTGVGVLGVVNNTGGSVVGADGDFSQISTNLKGATKIDADIAFQRSNGDGLLKAEDSASANLDAMVAVGGVVNETTADRAVDGDYIQIAQTRVGTVLTGDIYDANLTSSRRTAKLEDSAAASGDALVGVAAESNASLTNKAATSGDYTTIASGTYGNVIGSIIHDPNIALTNQVTRIEDVGATAAGALIGVGYITQDPLSVDQNGNDDNAQPKVDRAGRTITTLAPAGETWQSCTSPMTGTGDTQIKANVASNRIYVTNITCSNTAAVSSLIYFKDGSSTIYVGGVGSSTLQGVANYVNTLPVPLRLTSNTAFNAAMATTATSTTCCASGYISVN